MSVSETYSCDQCGVDKKASNHWWVLVAAPAAYMLRTWENVAGLERKASGSKHLCGLPCVFKTISELEHADVEVTACTN